MIIWLQSRDSIETYQYIGIHSLSLSILGHNNRYFTDLKRYRMIASRYDYTQTLQIPKEIVLLILQRTSFIDVGYLEGLDLFITLLYFADIFVSCLWDVLLKPSRDNLRWVWWSLKWNWSSSHWELPWSIFCVSTWWTCSGKPW